MLIDKEYENLLGPVYDFLVINDDPKKADAIFLFGSVKLKTVWDRALDLYKTGYAKTILITGAMGADLPGDATTTEAEQISKYLIEHGVPKEVIIKESRATNTLENVCLGMAALKWVGINPRSLILVAKPMHIRRCAATFKKQYPQIELTCCPPMGTIHDAIDRPKKEFAERMIGEVERLKKYAEKGDIARVDIPKEVFSAIARIKEYLATAG